MKRRDFVRSAITGTAAAAVIPVSGSMGKQQESYFSKNIPVKYTVDVFVAGGGPAGIAAAVTATRQGQKVFIAEEQSCFGGVGTAAGLPMFCYISDGKLFLAEGIGREVTNRLKAKDGIVPSQYEGPQTDLFYKTEILKIVYDEMVLESKAQFSFCTHLIGVDISKNKIDRVICWGKSGIFSVKAKMYIDCTGDGDMAAWAGAPFEKGDEKGNLMPPTLISMWANINWKKAIDNDCGLWKQQNHLVKAIDEKAVSITDKHLPGMIMTGKTTGYGNIGHTYGVDSTDEVSVTKGLIDGRKMMAEYERFYKQYLKGYEEMELVSTAAKLGIRESRRITGDYILTADDYKNKSSFADEIGRYSYSIDLHTRVPSNNTLEDDWKKIGIPMLKPGETYGIPYRCLTPKAVDNLLVAGRCISCDSIMVAAIRVMPGSFVTGQAAGMAASLAVEKNTTTRGIPVDELRTRLKKFGAYLP